MADTALATSTDLQARGADMSDASRVQAAIEDASNDIHAATGEAWIDDDDGTLVADIPGIATTICCRVALRILDNPRGVVDRSEQVGSYSTRERLGDSGETYLNQREVQQLRAAAGLPGGLGTLTLTRGDMETPRVREPDWYSDLDTTTS